MRLKSIYPSKFSQWVLRSGFNSEFEFWRSFSGLSDGTEYDLMNDYLGSLGYVGTAFDRLFAFLRDQTGKDGTMFDIGNEFFDGTYSPVSGGSFEFADGSNFTFADGSDFEFGKDA